MHDGLISNIYLLPGIRTVPGVGQRLGQCAAVVALIVSVHLLCSLSVCISVSQVDVRESSPVEINQAFHQLLVHPPTPGGGISTRGSRCFNLTSGDPPATEAIEYELPY